MDGINCAISADLPESDAFSDAELQAAYERAREKRKSPEAPQLEQRCVRRAHAPSDRDDTEGRPTQEATEHPNKSPSDAPSTSAGGQRPDVISSDDLQRALQTTRDANVKAAPSNSSGNGERQGRQSRIADGNSEEQDRVKRQQIAQAAGRALSQSKPAETAAQKNERLRKQQEASSRARAVDRPPTSNVRGAFKYYDDDIS